MTPPLGQKIALCRFWVAHQTALGCCCRLSWTLSPTDQRSEANGPRLGQGWGTGAWHRGAGLPASTATAGFARGSPALDTAQAKVPLPPRAAEALPPAALHALSCLGPKGSVAPPNCSAWPPVAAAFTASSSPASPAARPSSCSSSAAAGLASCAAPPAAAASCQPPSPAPQAPSAWQQQRPPAHEPRPPVACPLPAV